jgi:hypothetical protein
MEALEFSLKQEMSLKTGEIEGERLDAELSALFDRS